jgi:2-polyprenyl-3-methyl-5-hydroxy-6-metoxy-1,4-benzoquinol methylase
MPGLRLYGRIKLASDPVYKAAHQALSGSALPLLDIGCGAGLLSFFLRSRGYSGPIHGIDKDAMKVGAASLLAKRRAGLSFEVGDVRKLPPFSGNVALLDVLHYLDPTEQATLIDAIIDRVAPGGTVVIRECLRDESWRFGLTRLEEKFARRVGWLRFDQLHFPSAGEIMAPFHQRGFSSRLTPLWGHTPFNNYFLVFRAPAISVAEEGITHS